MTFAVLEAVCGRLCQVILRFCVTNIVLAESILRIRVCILLIPHHGPVRNIKKSLAGGFLPLVELFQDNSRIFWCRSSISVVVASTMFAPLFP